MSFSICADSHIYQDRLSVVVQHTATHIVMVVRDAVVAAMGGKTESFVGAARIPGHGQLPVFKIEGGLLNGSAFALQNLLRIQHVVQQAGKQAARVQFAPPVVAAGAIGSEAHQLAVAYLLAIQIDRPGAYDVSGRCIREVHKILVMDVHPAYVASYVLYFSLEKILTCPAVARSSMSRNFIRLAPAWPKYEGPSSQAPSGCCTSM